MRAIIGWLAAFLASSLGWWLGARIGFGTGIFASVLLGAVGLYLGYRWFDDNLK